MPGKQERRRKKMNKIEIFKFGFLNLVKNTCSRTFGVDLAFE